MSDTPDPLRFSLERDSNRILDAILAKGLQAGVTVADEFRRKVLALTRKKMAYPELVQGVRKLLVRYEPLLSRTLSDTLLASWIAGATEIPRQPANVLANRLPPPDIPDTPIASASAGEPLITFPKIEAASKDLLTRHVMTRREFDSLAQDARREAFTVARVASLETLDHIRQTLARDVREGGTLREFREQVAEVLEGTPLSKGHVENVFRTNVAQANTAGLMDVLSDPVVQGEFVYLAYYAIHDGRVRPDHLAMETLGLDGTNIYRADDPIWREYLPPWDYL